MKYQNAIFLSGLLSADVSAQMFKKVKMKDVDVLTLYQGKMTNGRRSSPIPQLQCRGGSAGCSAFIPDVVQCYNRGSDGLETQWECKTEMPMEYKFGKVQVSCEGYDYPDDPYILAGSCGLEYTIDRTGVNSDKTKSNKGSNSYSSNGWNNGKSYQDEDSSSFGLLVFICIVGFIIFKALISPDRTNEQQHQQQAYNPDFIPPAGSDAPPPPYSAGNTQPPPYSSGRRNTSTNGNGAWANAASFGAGWAANSWWNRDSTRPRNRVYPDLHAHRDRSPSPVRNSNRNRSRSRSSGSSSGTRTASGFGGTSRR